MRAYYWKLPEQYVTEPIETLHAKISAWFIRNIVKNGEILFARKCDRDEAIERITADEPIGS